MDDFIASVSDVEVFVMTTAKEIMSADSSDLFKWMTNSPALKNKWKETL